MRVERWEEYAIGPEVQQDIHLLLRDSFSVYPEGRTYFRQVPTFRYLMWDGEILVAQLGVDYRMMNNGGQCIRTFGIVDLCVSEPYRHRGIAAELLDQLERLGQEHHIDFIILWAKDRSFYQKKGFIEVSNPCKWLLIQGDESQGLLHRRVGEGLMVLRLGKKEWREGTLDYLGHIF